MMQHEKADKDFKVLIVDDLSENLRVVGTLLDTSGISVSSALSGMDALDILQHDPEIDLILLDIFMPDMDGYEVCRRIKELPGKKDIPIIFLTAKTAMDDILKGFEVGAVDYVTKPFNHQELLSRVTTHLELKRSKDKIQEQNKELEESNNTKNKLFSVIAHDLKSPLGIFLSFFRLLRDNHSNIPSEQLLEMIDQLSGHSRNIIDLLDNLLSWAQMRHGALEGTPEVIPLKPLIEDSFAIYHELAVNKSLTFEFLVPEYITVFADKEMTLTVIRNLISNAIKFSYAGGIVKIQAKIENKKALISVVDSGVGIPEEIINKILNPNEYYTSKGTKSEKGSGLGLKLCKEFIEKNHGQICIERNDPKGTSIYFTLPIPPSQG